MRRTSIRLITALLAVMLLVSLGAAALAANAGTTVTKDGVKAHLYTDKESYASGNAVDARVKVDNETGKKISVSISIQVPNGVKLAGSASSAATVEAAKSYTTPGPKNPGSSTPGTGDGTPLLLLALLAVLSACGIGVWVIFGKKFRSMVSLLLVISMVASMGLMAVPAKAADLEGTIELSCPIKIDGKAATVTATVTYTISGGTADETTPDESTPDESTPDESTPDESTPDESTPDESTPDETTPDESAPDESTPDESTPDESTPDESTPDESTPDESTPDESTPDESTPDESTPDETPPDEDEPVQTPDETAYYLVWDTFTMVSANAESVQGYSGWDYYMPTATAAAAGGGAQFSDNSSSSDAHMLRAFNATSEDFTWEFTVKADASLEGTKFDLRNGDTVAISLTTKGGKLYAGETELADISGKYVNIKAQVNVAEGTYTIMADGKVIPGTFSFDNKAAKIDRMYIETTEEAVGSIYLGTVRIYVGYYINEKFLDTDAGIPADWTVTGGAAIASLMGTQDKDRYSARFVGDASMAKDVAYEQAGSWVEAQILNPDNSGEVAMILSDGENEFKVAIKEGKFGYYKADGSFTGLYDCLKNQWYHVMLKDTDEGTFLYLNHKEKAEVELPFEKFTSIEFETADVTGVYVDDIIVRDWIPYPADYVPTPTAVTKTGDNADILVGLQSCSLWTEGHHFGWDWLTDWEERKTVLGWYDEYLPETADWELKFKVEHGVDFELFCWYRPSGGNNVPIKYCRNAEALHEGYFNAKYSDMMDFAITWECAGGGVAGSADFRTNVVPYWIEQYFKDERYLVIDNKPVVGMYNLTKLMSYFGGTVEGVKAELDYLRQACRDAGFDGCYIIMSNSYASNAADVVKAGFDGQYAYTWGHSSYNPEVQKQGMQEVQKAIIQAGGLHSGLIPVTGMGLDDRPWDRDEGGFITQKDWEELLAWTKEYMTNPDKLSQESLGSRMLLLDNWNEYGEGHFIMPAEINGFGYLDGVRKIFGDGNTSHTDAVPNAAQLERINHLYIQDRHVVKVDKNSDDADLEIYSDAYDWTFDSDTEGWTVAEEDSDKYRHKLDVFQWQSDDGAGVIYGKSPTDPATLGTTENGDSRIIDPSIQSPVLAVNAAEAKYIKVRMKCSGIAPAITPEIFFQVEGDTGYSGGKSVKVTYKAGEDGWMEAIFDMSSSIAWKGTVTKLRFDVIDCAGEFTIDSITFMKLKGQGDANVYFNNTRILTQKPVKYINDTVMYPVSDLHLLPLANTWGERQDGSAVELYLEGTFIRMPYDANKIIADGVEIPVAQGATKIDGEIYIPIRAIMETQENYLINWKADVKWINFTYDNSNDPYKALKAWYFNASKEGWVEAGPNMIGQTNGALMLTQDAASGRTLATWSPQATPINISTAAATHIRVRVKTDAGMPNELLLQAWYGTKEGEYVEYKVPYTTLDGDGYATVLIELSSDPEYATVDAIQRLFVSGVGNKIVPDGKSFWLDSVEILRDKSLPDVDVNIPGSTDKTVVKAWPFDTTKEGWSNGGATELIPVTGGYLLCEMPDGATTNSGQPDTQARIWSESLDVAASAVDHLRIRIKADDETAVPGLTVTLRQGTPASPTDRSVQITDLGQPDVNGFYTVTVKLADISGWSDLTALNQIGICEDMPDRKAFVLDSIELLKLEQTDDGIVKVLIIGNSITAHHADASKGWLGTWGMAATVEENDYVHRLMAMVNEKYSNVEFKWGNVSEYEKYFYDFRNIGNPQTAFIDWDADIIIATLGANIQNGANEGDMSFENDKIFTTEHYEAIIDQFNPGGDGKIIIGTTALSNPEIVDVIEEAAAENTDWAYTNMTEYTDPEYLADEEALKTAFQVEWIDPNVLSHPGDKGMEAIALELWPLLDAALKDVAELAAPALHPNAEEVLVNDFAAAQGDEAVVVLNSAKFQKDTCVGVYVGDRSVPVVITEAGKLTLPLAGLGMMNLGQYTVKVNTGDGKLYVYQDIWHVTKVITTMEDMKAVSYTPSTGDIMGYYILGGDITNATQYTVPGAGYIWSSGIGFGGTFDGRGYTISNVLMDSNGFFGQLGTGAVVKNVNFAAVSYKSADNATLLAGIAYGATIENVNVTIDTIHNQTCNMGILVSRNTNGATFRNITVDANSQDIPNVLGRQYTAATFANCVINNVKSTTCIWQTGGSNGNDTSSPEIPVGLTINYLSVTPAAEVKAWNFDTSERDNWTTAGWGDGQRTYGWDEETGAFTGTDVVVGSSKPGIWSPEQLSISSESVTHVQIRIKSSADAAKMMLCLFVNETNTEIDVLADYATETADADGYSTVLIDLRGVSGWPGSTVLNRIAVYPLMDNDNASFAIDSVKLLGTSNVSTEPEPDPEEPTHVVASWHWNTENEFEQWGKYSGSHTYSVKNGCFTFAFGASGSGNPRSWLNGTTFKAADITLIRIRFKSSVADAKLVLYLNDGNSQISLETTYVGDVNDDGFCTAKFNLTENAAFAEFTTVTDIAIYPLENTTSGTAYVDYLELLGPEQESTDPTA